MYTILLSVHSLIRWFVLATLLFALFRAYRGLLTNKPFTRFDNTIRHTTATISHIQLVVGLGLYFISPIIQYFLHNYKESVSQRATRFFGMEHILMMLIAIVLISIGSVNAKRKPNDQQKFKTIAIWFSIALLIIFVSIPWPFSPFSPNRPYFRPF